MALALAASAGLHAVAVVAAGWWIHPVVWHLKPIHVISVHLLEERGARGAQSVALARPDVMRVPLLRKQAVAHRRSATGEERALEPPQKVRIAQKTPAKRTPPAAPQPATPRRVTSAQRLSPQPASPPAPSSTVQEGRASGAGSGSPLVVAKAELSKGGGRDRDARLEAIRRLIERALVYPQSARRFGWEGTSRVRFSLAPDGQPKSVELVSSSRMAILDGEAISAVRRAAPYPYVEGTIVVPIVFDLKAYRHGMTPGGRR